MVIKVQEGFRTVYGCNCKMTFIHVIKDFRSQANPSSSPPLLLVLVLSQPPGLVLLAGIPRRGLPPLAVLLMLMMHVSWSRVRAVDEGAHARVLSPCLAWVFFFSSFLPPSSSFFF